MTASAALVGASLLAGASAAAPQLEALQASLAREPAKAVVDALARSGRWWAVVDRIGSGDTRWVALAPRLAPGTDAGTSESLGIALAYALPRNPRAVLAVVDVSDGEPSVAVDRACGVPFIEDTVKDVAAYVRRARRAVRAVADPALAAARAACLTELGR